MRRLDRPRWLIPKLTQINAINSPSGSRSHLTSLVLRATRAGTLGCVFLHSCTASPTPVTSGPAILVPVQHHHTTSMMILHHHQQQQHPASSFASFPYFPSAFRVLSLPPPLPSSSPLQNPSKPTATIAPLPQPHPNPVLATHVAVRAGREKVACLPVSTI